MSNEKMFGIMKELKIGKFVLIDDVPCKIVSIETSAPGKHGAAKMRVVGIGVFNGEKRTILKPSDADCEVPNIERKSGQIISIAENNAQVMDAASFEVFEITMPEEFKSDASAGKQIDYMETMGKRIVTRVY
ncbi:translation initiation factor IF-5A [Candidatus Micrarchaeota archaeon]|nr:translation initiation factor IF-5A [Candidatus Micrarchaeota archaeon]